MKLKLTHLANSVLRLLGARMSTRQWEASQSRYGCCPSGKNQCFFLARVV
jgi:hypothetical protein